MNPLAWKQCAPRLALAMAAMASLLTAAGCGSNNSITPLPGGFSRASLNGQYVIAQTGIAFNQPPVTSADPFSETIVFTADGNGNLSITVDDFDQDGGFFNDTTPSLPVTGIYGVSSDGTGFLQLNYSTPANYAITMIDDSHFYVIEQDFFATASGFGEKQDPTQFMAPPSGDFVFKAHNLGLSSRVGGITITGGAISGTEDFLSLGVLSSSEAVASSVAMSVPDATTGSGKFTLSDGTAFNYYVVNSNKFHFMSRTGSLEIGQAEKQSGSFSVATLASGSSYVFGSSGDTTNNTLAIHSAGVFTTDGAGHITAGNVDYVQDATVHSNVTVSGGGYTLTSNGRGQVNLTLAGDTISPQIFWMVDGTRAYFLADSASAVEDGTFSLQSGAPFSALGAQAAFVMDGFDVAFKDRVGVFAASGSGFKWNQAANSFDPNPLDLSFGGTPSVLGTTGSAQVSSNGRATVTVNGVSNGANAWVFYLSSPGAGFMVQEDTNPFGTVNNIGGAFSQQASQ